MVNGHHATCLYPFVLVRNDFCHHLSESCQKKDVITGCGIICLFAGARETLNKSRNSILFSANVSNLIKILAPGF